MHNIPKDIGIVSEGEENISSVFRIVFELVETDNAV